MSESTYQWRIPPTPSADDVSDLYATLLAKVTAHLELAQAATPGPWRHVYLSEKLKHVISSGANCIDDGQRPVGSHYDREDAAHVAANSPAHVIRACRADLDRLEAHAPMAVIFEPGIGCLHDWTMMGMDDLSAWPCSEIRRIAAVYDVEVWPEMVPHE